MSSVLNFIKIVLIIDTIILLCLVINYARDYKKIDKALVEDKETLIPIIQNTLKQEYFETRNKMILKDIKEVYAYEQILSDRVHKELLYLKNENQLKISRHTREDDIEMMIKYEISKLKIMIDKHAINKQQYHEEKTKLSIVDISDSLMV